MINQLLLVTSICGFALGLTASSILVFSNKSFHHASRLLALSLFSLAMALLFTFLMEWNLHNFTAIYRMASPLSYLTLPAAWLYIRTIINDETRLKNKDV